jgi:hypothetical protein
VPVRDLGQQVGALADDLSYPVDWFELGCHRFLEVGGWLMSDGQPRKRERARSFKLVRLIVIVVILLVAAGLGFYFKSQANSGREPSSFGNQPPQYINVFETNSKVPVAVTVMLEQGTYLSPIKLQSEGYTDFTEVVNVTASPARSVSPGIIMVTSSIAPQLDPGRKLTPVENRLGAERFVVQVPLSQDPSGTWSGVVNFGSIPMIFENNGSTFGHLPSVGAYEYPEGGVPSLFAEYEGTTGQLRKVINGPVDPDSHVTISGDHGELFYGPDSISYTETLHNIAPVLASQQIVYTTPAVDISGNYDYVWHSGAGLEPVFKETNPDAVDSQTQAAFYSGIAFGVAGAALIALIQEIRGKREDESSTSSVPRSTS